MTDCNCYSKQCPKDFYLILVIIIVVAMIGIGVSFLVLRWKGFRACLTNTVVIPGIQYAVALVLWQSFVLEQKSTVIWEENL